MTDKKYRCTKCGAMEVVLIEHNEDLLGINPPKFVCQKCGQEYDLDSGISVINNKTINTFPSPERDLDITDSFSEKIKSKRRTD